MPIEVRHLTHTYSAGSALSTVALNDVSFTVREGEFIGIVGHTGSGKTTLVQHLNGLLKPTSGQVLIDGEDLNGASLEGAAPNSNGDYMSGFYKVDIGGSGSAWCFSIRNTSCSRKPWRRISLSGRKTRVSPRRRLTGVSATPWKASTWIMRNTLKRAPSSFPEVR